MDIPNGRRFHKYFKFSSNSMYLNDFEFFNFFDNCQQKVDQTLTKFQRNATKCPQNIEITDISTKTGEMSIRFSETQTVANTKRPRSVLIGTFI